VKARKLTKDAESLFHDPEFPHNNTSLGRVAVASSSSFEASWIPVRFLQRGWWKLFEGIEASDLLQGSLGNCWLVAALASLAEFPQEVQKIFVDATNISRGGKYTLRLYDHRQDAMRNIVIDEFIPCHQHHWWEEKGMPLFAKPNGNEAWVLLLEKAMAKMLGSYSELDGGNAAVAFRALTGEKDTGMWKKDTSKGKWTRWQLADKSTSFSCWGMPKEKSTTELFSKILGYNTKNYLMAASMRSVSGREHKRKDGLVEGHAYSLLQVVESEGQSLVCLRNPWGNDVQWNGAWSDGDAMWRRHNGLRQRLRPNFQPDGIFWMNWSDFVARWDTIIVCSKSMRTGEAATAHAHSNEVGVSDPSILGGGGGGGRIVRPPAFGSIRLPAKSDARLNCPGKHGLCQQPESFGAICDLCRRGRGHDGADMFGCRTCDFDVCSRCVARSPGIVPATALCITPGCGKLTWDGKPGGKCSKTCGQGGYIGGSGEPSVPAIAEEPLESPSELKVACPGSHSLLNSRITRKHFTCDICSGDIKSNSWAWICPMCDFYACTECAFADPAKRVSKGTVTPESASKSSSDESKRMCKSGCGRPAFGSFPTCCTHCRGIEGPHAKDCATKSGTSTSDPELVLADRHLHGPTDDIVIHFDTLRIETRMSMDFTPCEHGCGRPAFGKFTTCCTHCHGEDGPHARDCGAKAGL